MQLYTLTLIINRLRTYYKPEETVYCTLPNIATPPKTKSSPDYFTEVYLFCMQTDIEYIQFKMSSSGQASIHKG